MFDFKNQFFGNTNLKNAATIVTNKGVLKVEGQKKVRQTIGDFYLGTQPELIYSIFSECNPSKIYMSQNKIIELGT